MAEVKPPQPGQQTVDLITRAPWYVIETPNKPPPRNKHRCKLPRRQLAKNFGVFALIECVRCGQRWRLHDIGAWSEPLPVLHWVKEAR